MGNVFTRGPAAPIMQQVTLRQQPQLPQQPRLTFEDRMNMINQALTALIDKDLLPNTLNVEQLTMICHYWLRQTSNDCNPHELHDDVVSIIIEHSSFEILEAKLMHKIIEHKQIASAMEWFFTQTTMHTDQILIVEILASKRKYINCHYMSRYLERPNIDEISRMRYLQLCGITESLGGIEPCFRHFFANCCLNITSHEAFDYPLLFAALSKTMLMNGNIKDDTHRRVFEEDMEFIPRLLHTMFWSTAKSQHYRGLSLRPSNPVQAFMAEKHGVMADILEMFEPNPLEMEHGIEDLQVP
eukprot:516517_1